MKSLKLSLMTILSTCLFSPVISHAESFEAAVQNATAAVDKAKAANYEWRDSRKLLKQASELNKDGQSGKAMELVEQVEKQGKLAVAQAELQSTVSGPR